MADFLNDLFHHSTANAVGGHDLFSHDGALIGRTADNIFGGENTYDAHGKLVGRSTENIFGGEDHFDALGHKVGFTAAGVGGAETLFDVSGQPMGSVHHAAGAVQLHSPHGDVLTFRQNLMGGFTADPLNNMASIAFPPLF